MGLRPGLASGACVWLPVAALLCCSSAFASYPSLLPAIAACSPHRFAYVNPAPFLLLAIKILLTHFWLPKKDQRKVSICVYYSCFSIHYRSCNFTSRIRLSPPLPIFHSPQYVSCCYRPTKRGSEKSSKLRTLWKFQMLDVFSLKTPQWKWASTRLEGRTKTITSWYYFKKKELVCKRTKYKILKRSNFPGCQHANSI